MIHTSVIGACECLACVAVPVSLDGWQATACKHLTCVAGYLLYHGRAALLACVSAFGRGWQAVRAQPAQPYANRRVHAIPISPAGQASAWAA